MTHDTIELLYDRGSRTIRLPPGCVPTVVRKHSMPVLPDPGAAIAEVLARPMDAPPLAELALKCYRKVPGKGPLAPSLGNACVLALARGGLRTAIYSNSLVLVFGRIVGEAAAEYSEQLTVQQRSAKAVADARADVDELLAGLRGELRLAGEDPQIVPRRSRHHT